MTKGDKETFDGDGYVLYLDCGDVIKTYQIICLKYVQFAVCQGIKFAVA